MTLLNTLILVPFLTALLVVLVPGNYRFVIRCIALLGTAIAAVLGTVLFFKFVPGGAGFQFESSYQWADAGGLRLAFHTGVDGISAGMLLVSAVVGFAAVAVSWEIERQAKLYYILLLSIIGGALGAFASLDLFYLYFFNEIALVPTFIMIGVWGRGDDRNYAAFKITLYLTLGAMVGLVGLIALYTRSGADSLDIVKLQQAIAAKPLAPGLQDFVFFCLVIGFGTLVGLFPFHSWAPQGYACAPTATAMLHAGILKKVGLLALLRVALPMLPGAVSRWGWVLAVLCVGNLLYCGFVAMRQRDLNLLIGNSSLAHMGFAFLGLATVNVIGVTGTVLVMVSHALLAALSFALSGWLRRQTGTIEIGQMGGLLARMPFIGTVLIACFLAGCGVPGFANFAGELTVMFGAWHGLPAVVVVAAWSGLVIGGVYMLRSIRDILHGAPREELREARDAVSWWRRLPFAVLVLGLIYFGIFPNTLANRIRPAAAEVVRLAKNTGPAPTAKAATATPAPAK